MLERRWDVELIKVSKKRIYMKIGDILGDVHICSSFNTLVIVIIIIIIIIMYMNLDRQGDLHLTVKASINEPR